MFVIEYRPTSILVYVSFNMHAVPFPCTSKAKRCRLTSEQEDTSYVYIMTHISHCDILFT